MTGPPDAAPSRKTSAPPTAFNVIARAFNPRQAFTPTEGLLAKVFGLQVDGRLRSALDEVLAVLDQTPDDPEALTLAMMLVGGSRSEHLAAVEPLDEGRLFDPRLDPIWSVCSHCHKTEWIPLTSLPAVAPEGAPLHVKNPLGLQCYACGYVVCRKCLVRLSDQLENLERRDMQTFQCPNCGARELGVPVFPTGRLQRQVNRAAGLVVHILVFREGPVMPDPEYIQDLLDSRAPETWVNEVDAHIRAYPMPRWPEDVPNLARAFVARMLSDGSLPLDGVEFDCATSDDDQGNRIAISRVMLKHPPEGRGYPTEADIGALINLHLNRMRADGEPSVIAMCDGAGDPHAVAFASRVIRHLVPLAIEKDRHCWLTQWIGRWTRVAVSVFPVAIEPATRYLPDGYLPFLVNLRNQFGLYKRDRGVFVHWVFCAGTDTGKHVLHASMTLEEPKGATYAIDLLSAEERKLIDSTSP